MRNWYDIRPVKLTEELNPFWFMTIEQFQIGINSLVRGGLILPYGVPPGSRPGGIVDAVCTSWARWKTYDWNPPEFLPSTPKSLIEYGDTDLDASPKPSWQKIRRAYDTASLADLRERHMLDTRAECRRRITEAYGAESVDDEIFTRLRGEHTLVQDAERERLRAKCRELGASLATLDREALDMYDASADNNWSAR